MYIGILGIYSNRIMLCRLMLLLTTNLLGYGRCYNMGPAGTNQHNLYDVSRILCTFITTIYSTYCPVGWCQNSCIALTFFSQTCSKHYLLFFRWQRKERVANAQR